MSRRSPLLASLALTLLAWALLMVPRLAHADTWGQYLVLIDDSGSMNQSDPDRLVMLASLSLAAGLGDADQIMVVGLNELARGEVSGPRFISPGQLLAERDGAEGARTLAQTSELEHMARHQGGTPCKQALDMAATLLESVAGAGTPQTLLMLTDGACSGALDPAEQWLGRLRSHAEGRFRFALLSKKQSGEPLDPALVEYATRTGWTADPDVPFDSRSLLAAFAEVLSFSRGLRYDGGGRVGLARSFAGAREVRVLAVSPEGRAPITLAKQREGGSEAGVSGGPTFQHGQYGWSLRVAKGGSEDLPVAYRSPDPGVEVLVIPTYGELRLEAVVGPCADAEGEEAPRPKLPWTRERAVRSGQPACAWARLVGDSGETIQPIGSFNFEMELCEDEACARSSAMQPDSDGTFNAQLGVLPEGRSERWFRARAGSLAAPVGTRRGIQAMAFGIADVVLAEDPDTPVVELELGVFPQSVPKLLNLEFSGSFPDASQAAVRCALVGASPELEACMSCTATPADLTLQDPFTVQLELRASNFCPPISTSVGELPLALELQVEPKAETLPAGETMAPRRVPLRASLRHATLGEQTVAVTGGAEDEAQTLAFPRPVNGVVQLALEPAGGAEIPEDLSVALEHSELRLTGEAGQTASVGLLLGAADCCATGDYAYVLRVRDADDGGGPSLELPFTVRVAKPSFWVCPGKLILKWTLAALGLGLLIWLIRGFSSPRSFADTAVLARAESHEALSKLNEGDEDWRLIRSLEATKRGFYKHATVHLGGPTAALPSLRELPADARIEARGNGNASLIVEAEGIETFKESSGWTPVPVGELPVSTSIVLRRDDTYLMFRR